MNFIIEGLLILSLGSWSDNDIFWLFKFHMTTSKTSSWTIIHRKFVFLWFFCLLRNAKCFYFEKLSAHRTTLAERLGNSSSVARKYKIWVFFLVQNSEKLRLDISNAKFCEKSNGNGFTFAFVRQNWFWGRFWNPLLNRF